MCLICSIVLLVAVLPLISEVYCAKKSHQLRIQQANVVSAILLFSLILSYSDFYPCVLVVSPDRFVRQKCSGIRGCQVHEKTVALREMLWYTSPQGHRIYVLNSVYICCKFAC
jgi:hypothetical protein